MPEVQVPRPDEDQPGEEDQEGRGLPREGVSLPWLRMALSDVADTGAGDDPGHHGTDSRRGSAEEALAWATFEAAAKAEGISLDIWLRRAGILSHRRVADIRRRETRLEGIE